MSITPSHTTQLHAWIDRLRTGDRGARDDLLRGIAGRLYPLAQKMLGRFPNVRRWADTDDVLQNAQLRLLRALETVRPDSARSFFGLAAEQIRRELIDLARHFYGAEGVGANHASHGWRDDPPALADEGDELEKWAAFHEAVARLPAAEREVVGLIFYHAWTKSEVAELMGVAVRTVQRRWESALARLHRRLKERGGGDAS
jgi:RNA polymerase sigma factor (sigma-70 family)